MRPIVFIGLISYSLYLWHWPVLVFAKYWLVIDSLPAGMALLLLVLSVILAIISWKFVETPFRKRIVLKTRAQIFLFAGVITVMLLLIGLSIKLLKGVPSRIPAAAQQYASGRTDRAFINELSLNDALSGNFVELGSGDKSKPIDVFVWGDSLAMAAMPAMDFLCKKYAVRGLAATHSSTRPIIGVESTGRYSLQKDSIAYNEAILRFIKRNNVKSIVLVAHWSGYVTAGSPGVHHKSITRINRGLIETITALQGTGTKVWIMKEVPTLPFSDPPRALVMAVMRHQDPAELGFDIAEQQNNSQLNNSIFEGLTAINPRVIILDPTFLFVNSNDFCRLEKNGKSLYVDNTHLTVAGSMELCPLFEPIFDKGPVKSK